MLKAECQIEVMHLAEELRALEARLPAAYRKLVRPALDRAEALAVRLGIGAGTPRGPQANTATNAGNGQPKRLAVALARVTEAALRDTGAVLAIIPDASHADQLNILGAAERALEIGNRPAAMFVNLVMHSAWTRITADQVARANNRLNHYRHGVGRKHDSILRQRIPSHRPPQE